MPPDHRTGQICADLRSKRLHRSLGRAAWQAKRVRVDAQRAQAADVWLHRLRSARCAVAEPDLHRGRSSPAGGGMAGVSMSDLGNELPEAASWSLRPEAAGRAL